MKQKVLFVFIDGVGLGSDDPAVNPLADRERLPHLAGMMDEAAALDAQLGVSGLPQSATGQAALLCGLNAPDRMGRHIEGFPPPRLKELVREHNLLSTLRKAGKICTFSNAYWIDNVSQIPPRRESVTTVTALAALGGVRGKAELLANRAVYHDLTRERIRVDRSYDGELITPEMAAEHLIDVANDYHFTLFEFFQTDQAGHRGDPDYTFQTLEKLERFFAVLRYFSGLIVVTSDHGNIEELGERTHTTNPVPLFLQFPERDKKSSFAVFENINRIDQIAPAILEWLKT